ncbi:MAG TPA: diguanylate cyclase [Polyangiaceae bacterium]|jgi:diguanylate cyclase (GGDEF)-like protein
MSRWVPIAAFIAFAMAALVFATARVADAYDWVAHTSDVRVAIARAEFATTSLGHDTEACTRLAHRVDELAELTRDNPRQQKRVAHVRELEPAACARDASATHDLMTELENGDSNEIDLLYARRSRLTTTAVWALALFVGSLAGAFAAAFSGIRARRAAERKLQTMAVTDELTQLSNRRGFMMLAGHEHRLAQRQGRGLLLVFADLDGLKAINDGLGHEQGDAAIRDFAGVMRTAFRASDIVARLGGDEFAALAYDVASDDADKVEERVASALDAFNADSKRPYRLAASVGTAFLRSSESLPLDELVARADGAMYEKKRAKRRSPQA